MTISANEVTKSTLLFIGKLSILAGAKQLPINMWTDKQIWWFDQIAWLKNCNLYFLWNIACLL